MDTNKLEKIVTELNRMKEIERLERGPFEVDEDDNYVHPNARVEIKAFRAKMVELDRAITAEVASLMSDDHTPEDAKRVGRIIGLRM